MINRILSFLIAFILAYLDPSHTFLMCVIAGLFGRIYIAVWIYLNFNEIVVYLKLVYGLVTQR